MSAKTRDGTRKGAPFARTSIVPEFPAAFWIYWLLAAMAGEIAGHALNHIYLHRSGRVIVALTEMHGQVRFGPPVLFSVAKCPKSSKRAQLSPTLRMALQTNLSR
ncbi:hypothetical protein ABIF38_003518 [Bradyrhizobium japonicum]|jgi:hypothetical protein|uniref:Uncharacterized protein n=1 Tax=Bradyrhizobium elkanii TaxID=29448 RepID=A0ABV4FBE1_BRAEL|nr:hypothetical protein [Bradyrhizobium elkanii]MBP2432515.1 hypothetical protein [Bradyrhizobium elkanii]MCP1734169.1 hypothetical protein [Bradyrhizobium elkanii]MCP1751851.1 hypothetical protein [Bradyrhizobium elkanii]MCP1966861.1 hypothetical protein [Bradyrhizobium elkanii]MCP1977622.1 hypothetical protein [Bradyrhizobium elkanii]